VPTLHNLPEAVVERLGTDSIPGVDLVTTYRGRQFHLEERRRPVEVRVTESGDPIIEGYASTTGVWYEVYGGPPWGWREKIEPGAFRQAITRGDDTRLLVNHEGVPIARTASGTLELDEDGIGLHVLTPSGVDRANPKVVEVVSAMFRGTDGNTRRDLDEMSFAFMVDVDAEGKRMEDWNEDFTERTIYGVRLFDAALVTYPANPATAATVRGAISVPGSEEPRLGLPLALAQAIAEAERLTA
jgi:hypothetical protein